MPVALDEDLLDDAERLLGRDVDGRLRRAATAGAQIRELIALSGEAGVARLAGGGPPRTVLIAGGGEATHLAPMLTALAGTEAPAPVLGIPAGSLPPWAGAADLVVVCSSGADSQQAEEELLLLADAAARRGTALLGLGRAGGALNERCARARAPFVALPADRVDGAALWSLATPVLLVAQDLHLVEVDLEAAATALDTVADQCRPDSESFVNPAKVLALQLGLSAPVLVADSPGTAVAATRMAAQLAAVAGIPAPVAALPAQLRAASAYLTGLWAPTAGAADMFADPLDQTERALRLVALRDLTHPAGADAMREVLRRAEHAGVPVSELPAEGSDRLSALTAHIALADFTACYLRLATPVPHEPSAAGQGTMEP